MAANERDYVVHGMTTSLCSTCLAGCPAKIVLRGGSVYLLKRCALHGEHEEMLEEDAAFWMRRGEYDKPGTRTRAETQVRDGCPHDCGLCPDHEQHTCIGLLEVTSACDLGCPICFAHAGSGSPLPLATIDRMLATYQEAEGGKADVLQISGGEPTTHPDILGIVRLARRRGIRYVMLNTNGLRIAREPAFAAALADFHKGFEVYLQFDGLTASAHQMLRGRDLRAEKTRALDNLRAHGVPVTLVCTVQRDVNDDQLGALVDFGIHDSIVRGISFQPLAFFGRTDGADPTRRITLTGVLKRLERQTEGMIRTDDFIPLPCNVERVAFTLMLRLGSRFVPITRKADVRKYVALLPNTLAFYAEDVLKNAAGAALCGDAGCDCLRFVKDFVPLASLGAKALMARDKPTFATENVFRISVASFLDRYNFEMKAMKKECVHVLTPDGRRIPFSAYNLFHRPPAPLPMDEPEREAIPC